MAAAKTIRIPLVGTFNPRGPYSAYGEVITTGKDQLFNNCQFELVKNPVTQSANLYCSKLYAYWNLYTAGDGTYDSGHEIVGSEFGGNSWAVAAFGNSTQIANATASRVVCGPIGAWPGTSSVGMGITSGVVTNIVETIIGGIKTFLITANDGTGWFLAKDSVTSNDSSINVAATFTATTNGTTTLSSVSSFAGRYVGQALSGTNIAAGARIAAMDSGASTITMTIAATGSTVGVTVTAERLAKIIDADFPSSVIGPFSCLGGWNFIMTTDGRIYNSDLNTIISWTSGNYISTNFYPDNGRAGAWVVGNRIIGFSTGSAEWFYNAGNASGSPLSPSTELNFKIGAINSRSVCQVEDKFFWISALDSGSCSVFQLNGSTPVELSNPQLTALMSSSSSSQPFPIVITGFRFAGKIYLIVGGVFTLDYETKIWAYWGVTNVIPHRATGIFGLGNYQTTRSEIIAVSQSSGVNLISAGTFSGANAIGGNLVIRTSRLDLGTGNLKTPEYYELDSDIQASGTATLEVSDDDFQTWTTVGTFDMTKMHPRIHRGKAWRGGRAHRITHSASTPFRASTLTIKYRDGAH